MPEPPDAAMVVVGDDPRVLLVRDDHSAREAGYELGRHWFLGHDGQEAPLSWAQVLGAEPDEGQLVADRSVIQRVFTQAELDEAVRAASLTVVGDHLMEPGGYCRTHGSIHRPEELARAEDRLEEAERC